MLAQGNHQKRKQKMEANVSTVIHSKRKQNAAGGQCLHTEAFTKYNKTNGGQSQHTEAINKRKQMMEANASTLMHSKRKQHAAGGQCLATEACTK
jgi:hypothetical protein